MSNVSNSIVSISTANSYATISGTQISNAANSVYVDPSLYNTCASTYASSGFSSIDHSNVFIDDSLKEKLVKSIIEDLDSELSSDVDIVVNYIRKRLSQIMDDPDNTIFKTENEIRDAFNNRISKLKEENDELRAIINDLRNIVNGLQYQINNLKLSGTNCGNQTSTSPINPYPNSIGVMF